MPEELSEIFQVLEGGANTGSAQIIQFPVDAAGAAAETALSGEGISTTVTLGNGVATEVSQFTVLEGGANTTTGLGLLSMDVGAAGAAIAPALGVLAGVGLYNLAPDFWTGVADALTEAGQTVGGQVRAFINGDNGQVGFSETTIEIIKNALLDVDMFKSGMEIDTLASNLNIYYYDYDEQPSSSRHIQGPAVFNQINWQYNFPLRASRRSSDPEMYTIVSVTLTINGSTHVIVPDQLNSFCCVYHTSRNNQVHTAFDMTPYASIFAGTDGTASHTTLYNGISTGTQYEEYGGGQIVRWYECNGKKLLLAVDRWYSGGMIIGSDIDNYYSSIMSPYSGTNYPYPEAPWFSSTEYDNPNVQPDATYPSSEPFPQTYPTWMPWTAPSGVPWPAELPAIYPVEVPAVNPNANQQQAQNPDPSPDPEPLLDYLKKHFPIPKLNPQPTPTPVPDPDPQPDPDPIPVPDPEPVEPNPPDPNKPVDPSPTPVVPVLPDTMPSTSMFTVYAPSLANIRALGAWLWSTDIIEQVLRMWQNPLDGIIAFMIVYCDITTDRSSNIQIGYLDTGISSRVISQQFATIECGSVQIKEYLNNATDYSPYTSIHLYLPFIGVVELDSDEFMGGTMTITYKVDMYTGTCLAMIKCTRQPDMPEPTILYTFSGNAAQQLPLTASSFGGALSSLVSAVSGGIAIASGGGVAGAAMLGHSLTHEMVHIGHSGSLSANAGIMAPRIPYVILSRKHSYDANGYNAIYGYPANKTVNLGNCTGFVRVKAGHLRSKASENEKSEIMNLLKEGVIL